MLASSASNLKDIPKSNTVVAGIDLSSWLSWASYGVGFSVALRLAPGMADDLTSGSAGSAIALSAVVLFFVLILVIQRQMSLSLRNTSFGAPRKLVAEGIFAVSRNPMYVAFLMPLASIAWYSPVAALAAATLYVVSMNGLVISVEEQILDAAFGSQFRRYCKVTPRWLVW